ncbi:integrase [Shewanella sp. OPT22]|nr:integrase [Shewanella sp. OPT22]
MQLPPVLPLFDKPEFLLEGNSYNNQYITQISLNKVTDAGLVLEHASDWLYEHKDQENNYKAYRSELTTFLHWCFDVAAMSPADLKRKDMSRYVEYCKQPPAKLIGNYNVAQFKGLETDRTPNANWRPFIAKLVNGSQQAYKLSENALKTKIAILSSFYTYLLSEEFCERNTAQVWLRHSRFANKQTFRNDTTNEILPIFTELQWSYVNSTVNSLAKKDSATYARHKFLIILIYSCYLRISDVSARAGYSPVMSQFKQNRQTGIWLFHIPNSKGGKSRTVTVSKNLLQAFIEYRGHLGLSQLPSSNELDPLFIRHKAAGRGRDVGVLNANLGIRQIRDDIQFIIQQAAEEMIKDGFESDANDISKLTAHNIRHTGISHDINIHMRPLSHVQKDAGHESIDTTSLYLHTTDVERYQSAQNKPLDHLGINS